MSVDASCMDVLTELGRVRDWCINGRARSIREASGFSLSEIAKAIEVLGPRRPDISAVSRWEKGERRPRGELAVAYGRVLARLDRRLSRASRH